jgi:hypothetical protein
MNRRQAAGSGTLAEKRRIMLLYVSVWLKRMNFAAFCRKKPGKTATENSAGSQKQGFSVRH